MKTGNEIISFLMNGDCAITRRRYIRLVGGSLGVLALTACSHCAEDTENLRKKTNDAGMFEQDKRYYWLGVAACAPSGHNMQPWFVDLEEENTIVIYADQKRFLPAVDPYANQMLIGLGAFLELLKMAIEADGFKSEISLFPQGEGERVKDLPIARVLVTSVEAKPAKDELFSYIGQRQCNRGVYEKNSSVSAADLEALLFAGRCYEITASGTVDSEMVGCLTQHAIEAWHTELECEDIVLETLRFTRVGRCEIESARDGIAVKGFVPELAAWLGLFERDKVPPRDSMAMRNMVKLGEEQAKSAAGWVWLSTKGHGRVQQIIAGRAFARLSLKAAQLGIALQPMTQAIGDYAAVQPHKRGLYHDVGVNIENERIQMLARIGYAPADMKSLRRYVVDFVKQR